MKLDFLGILTIVFIVLKLTDYIDWTWWWVLSPLWIPLLTALILFLAVLMILGIMIIFDKIKTGARK